jgi:hypothetical protein
MAIRLYDPSGEEDSPTNKETRSLACGRCLTEIPLPPRTVTREAAGSQCAYGCPKCGARWIVTWGRQGETAGGIIPAPSQLPPAL